MQKQTYMHKKEQVVRTWHLYDISGKVLGRAATEIATLLLGKHKPTYTPHVDGGDFVVVVNAANLLVTGNKMLDKHYHRHSNYPGGYKKSTLKELMSKDPARVVVAAVKGMLPKNKLQAPRLLRLKVYPGGDHPHTPNLNTNNQDKKE